MADRLLTDPDVRRFLLGRTVSELGNRITREGLPIVAILAAGATAEQLGVLAALSTLVGVALATPAGVAADRRRRRPLMVWCDILRAAALFSIPATAALHRLSFLQIAIVTAVVGGLTTVFDTADQAWLPQFVSRTRLTEGNAYVMGASAVGETGGPALMGALFQWIGGPLAIGVDALSYLASAWSLLAIRRPEPAPVAQEALPRASEGLSVSMRHPVLRPLLLTVATQSVFGGFFGALYELYALQTLHMTPLLLGLLITGGGMGALIGSWVASRLDVRRALLASALLSGLLSFLVPAARGDVAVAFAFLLGGQFLGDLAGTVFEVGERVVRQAVTPDPWLGRVNGSRNFLAALASAGGALAAGALGGASGLRLALWVAAAGQAAATLWLVQLRPDAAQGHGGLLWGAGRAGRGVGDAS
ncbi:MAG TPA: MFS transporter [Bacillota bacterium]|nr:MFS transporter [Bacillota bacterium]